MPIVNANDLIRHASKGGYRVPAIAFGDIESVIAIVTAAERLRTPAMLVTGRSGFPVPQFDLVMPSVEAVARASTAPIALWHVEIDDEKALRRALRLGFNGISTRSDDDETLSEIAQGCGAAVVEGEDVELGNDTVANDSKAIDALVRRSGAIGQSSSVTDTCALWCSVEHIVAFNAPELDGAAITDLFAKGIRELGSIPGVRDVKAGEAISDGARYRYCWLIRFASAAVVNFFKHHPAHVAFADRHFRPVAEDRLTTDYVLKSIPDDSE